MFTFSRYGHTQEPIDRANILAVQLVNYHSTGAAHATPRGYFVNSHWVQEAIYGSTGTFNTVTIPPPDALFPPEWNQRHAHF